MKLPDFDYNYVDYIWDFFVAKIKHRTYKVDTTRCFKLSERCPITGKNQFLKKCTRIRFEEERTTFYCEEYEFEHFLLTVDFDNPFQYERRYEV